MRINQIKFGAVLIPMAHKANVKRVEKLGEAYRELRPSELLKPSILEFLIKTAQATEPRHVPSTRFNPNRPGELLIDLKTSDEVMKSNLEKAGFQNIQIVSDETLKQENETLYTQRTSSDEFIIQNRIV